MPSQHPDHSVEERDPAAFRTVLQRTRSDPSPEVADLLAQVDRLRAVPGVDVSARFDTIRQGIRTLTKLEGTLAADTLDTLTDVTGRNDRDAMPVAYTAAVAALSDARHTASSAVQHALLGELRTEYASAADRNYAAVADAFNGLAASLAAAAADVDLRSQAVDVLHGTEEERAAWLTAEQVARRLDEHAALLAVAATAAGKPLLHESHRLEGEATEQWLQLTVDASGQDRRRVWGIWDAPEENVAGRWGGLLLAGLALRATPLAEIEPYARPQPSELGVAGRRQGDALDEAGDRDPAPPSQGDPAVEVRRISWQRALALLWLGSLTLGLALGCGIVALGFTVAAVIEPHDVFLAAREALWGDLLLGAGLSAGLTWTLTAAVSYESGARAVAPHRRKAPSRAYRGADLTSPVTGTLR